MGIDRRCFKVFSCAMVFVFLFSSVTSQSGFAGVYPLGASSQGGVVALSPAFAPVTLRGMKIYPDNPFQFDFILDSGDQLLNADELKEEGDQLIRYFLASLTIPEKDLWVNLSPYEQDRIIDESFAQTRMGLDLLAQDYLLKQITSSLFSPDHELGKKFWERVYQKSYELYGTTMIPTDAFHKVWIVPEKAVVYQDQGRALIVESSLKVMLEQDYVAQQAHSSSLIANSSELIADSKDKKTSSVDYELSTTSHELNHEPRAKSQELTSQIVREIILPELEREVNEGKNFAPLRQIYASLILAYWYKTALKESILNKVYADKRKVKGLDREEEVPILPAGPQSKRDKFAQADLMSADGLHKSGAHLKAEGLDLADSGQRIAHSQKQHIADSGQRIERTNNLDAKRSTLNASDAQSYTLNAVESIYSQYLETFKKGVHDLIRVEYDPHAQKNIPRRYFLGGLGFQLSELSNEGGYRVVSGLGYDDRQDFAKATQQGRFSLMPSGVTVSTTDSLSSPMEARARPGTRRYEQQVREQQQLYQDYLLIENAFKELIGKQYVLKSLDRNQVGLYSFAVAVMNNEAFIESVRDLQQLLSVESFGTALISDSMQALGAIRDFTKHKDKRKKTILLFKDLFFEHFESFLESFASKPGGFYTGLRTLVVEESGQEWAYQKTMQRLLSEFLDPQQAHTCIVDHFNQLALLVILVDKDKENFWYLNNTILEHGQLAQDFIHDFNGSLDKLRNVLVNWDALEDAGFLDPDAGYRDFVYLSAVSYYFPLNIDEQDFLQISSGVDMAGPKDRLMTSGDDSPGLIGTLYHNFFWEDGSYVSWSNMVSHVDDQAKEILLTTKDGRLIYDKNGLKVDKLLFSDKLEDRTKKLLVKKIAETIGQRRHERHKIKTKTKVSPQPNRLKKKDIKIAQGILELLKETDIYFLKDNIHGVKGIFDPIEHRIFLNKQVVTEIGIFHETGERFLRMAQNKDLLEWVLVHEGWGNIHRYLRGEGKSLRLRFPHSFRYGLQDKIFGAEENQAYTESIGHMINESFGLVRSTKAFHMREEHMTAFSVFEKTTINNRREFEKAFNELLGKTRSTSSHPKLANIYRELADLSYRAGDHKTAKYWIDVAYSEFEGIIARVVSPSEIANVFNTQISDEDRHDMMIDLLSDMESSIFRKIIRSRKEITKAEKARQKLQEVPFPVFIPNIDSQVHFVKLFNFLTSSEKRQLCHLIENLRQKILDKEIKPGILFQENQDTLMLLEDSERTFLENYYVNTQRILWDGKDLYVPFFFSAVLRVNSDRTPEAEDEKWENLLIEEGFLIEEFPLVDFLRLYRKYDPSVFLVLHLGAGSGQITKGYMESFHSDKKNIFIIANDVDPFYLREAVESSRDTRITVLRSNLVESELVAFSEDKEVVRQLFDIVFFAGLDEHSGYSSEHFINLLHRAQESILPAGQIEVLINEKNNQHRNFLEEWEGIGFKQSGHLFGDRYVYHVKNNEDREEQEEHNATNEVVPVAPTGGVDFSDQNFHLETKGQGVLWEVSDEDVAVFEAAGGLVPIIYSIIPIHHFYQLMSFSASDLDPDNMMKTSEIGLAASSFNM